MVIVVNGVAYAYVVVTAARGSTRISLDLAGCCAFARLWASATKSRSVFLLYPAVATVAAIADVVVVTSSDRPDLAPSTILASFFYKSYIFHARFYYQYSCVDPFFAYLAEKSFLYIFFYYSFSLSQVPRTILLSKAGLSPGGSRKKRIIRVFLI